MIKDKLRGQIPQIFKSSYMHKRTNLGSWIKTPTVPKREGHYHFVCPMESVTE